MSNVIVDKYKLDILANAIADKSGEPLTMTLDEMVEAVDGIDTGGITPTGNIDITAAGVTDVTNYATATVPNADVYVSTQSGFYTDNGTRKWQIKGTADVTDDGFGTPGYIAVNTHFESAYRTFNAVPSGTTITPSTSSQTIGGANYMMQGAVTVSAMPSGTAGTPTATKGTVSNHSVSVTPSVTNTTGYITGSTKTGTAVTVTASELASGNKEITQNGTNIDVVGFSTVSVSVSGGGGSVTQDANGYIVLPSTGGGGGGGSAQTATGTFSGNGTINASISCSFAPDLILVHGDLSGTASLRGVVHFLIIKDTESLQVVDGSNSAYSPSLYNEVYGISGYGGTAYPYATYSNGSLTLTMVQDTSSTRWTSGVTYNYTLVKWT